MGVSWNPFSLLLNADVERDNARSEEVSASLQKAVTFIAAGAFHKANKAIGSHLSFADWPKTLKPSVLRPIVTCK